MFEALGAAGIAISMLAYLPQVAHLAKEHCSAGVSSRAWMMWLVSSLLIGALAVHRHDAVFILLQISSLTAAAAILFLGHRYRGLVCEAHLHSIPRRWIGTESER
ncbi:MAG TPA: PQ-loop domain-containing transporter [Gaiellaceae bacterium]